MARTSTAVAVKKSMLPADINAALAAQVAAIQDRVSQPGGSKIGITQSKTFKLPSGLETPGPIDLVVVDFAYLNAYYTTAYDRNTITPPVCFAIHSSDKGMLPSDNSPERQCDSCAACSQNLFGSAGKGKACSNAVQLAVLPADFMDDPEQPLMILKVSATGLRPFNGYVSSLATSLRTAPWGVMTTIGFDPKSEYASLRFGNPRALDPEQLATVFGRQEEAQRMLTVEPDVSGYEAPAPAKKPAARARR
jgi:hypothetical protein